MVVTQFGAEDIDVDRVRFQRFGKFRYENQEHHVEVPLARGQPGCRRHQRRDCRFSHCLRA